MQNSASAPGVSDRTAIGHLAMHLDPARALDVPFLFEQQEKRLGGAFGLSALSHVAIFFLGLLIARYAPAPTAGPIHPDQTSHEIVWLAAPGPGGGGGGGGNLSPEPPRKAEIPGKDRIAVPVVKPPKLEKLKPQDEPPPMQALNIPAKTLTAGEQLLPGVLESTSAANLAQGSGSNGGAGTGKGVGIGSGEGSGLGEGFGGGTGGGVYKPGNGVEIPRVIREVKPQYTADAMRAKVQGTVWLECIVLPDGTVGSVEVTRSLDGTFGLDQEAVKAAKQWRFVPGTRFGHPVAVVVTIELTFTLR